MGKAGPVLCSGSVPRSGGLSVGPRTVAWPLCSAMWGSPACLRGGAGEQGITYPKERS